MMEHPEIRLSSTPLFRACYSLENNTIHFIRGIEWESACNCTEEEDIAHAFIHELTHWATFMFITKDEKDAVLVKYRRVIQMNIFATNNLLYERIADEVADDFVSNWLSI